MKCCSWNPQFFWGFIFRFIMVQCLIQNKIVFIGLEGYSYTHVTIKGRGIVITDLNRDEARDLIRDQELELAEPETYANYDRHLGKIYTDGKFKDYVNKRPTIKSNLLFLLEQLDK